MKEFAALTNTSEMNFSLKFQKYFRFISLSIKKVCSPSLPPCNIIFSPPSRLHVMFGVGEPVAAHFSVTLLPSRTTISVLVG